MTSSNNSGIYILLLSATIFFLILASSIVYFVILYQRKQFQNNIEKEDIKTAFQKELLKTQIEVQEQTLTNISREIHDNITQVLSFVKLNLGMIDNWDEGVRQKIVESRELVAQTINDLRNLSKSLSFEHIVNLGLVKTIEFEAERINNSGLVSTSFSIDGDEYSLGQERELVLFRIFQEALNNTLKHSGAKHLKINLQYSEVLFNLTLEDDGAGFLPGLLQDNLGAGIKNMKNRASLIGGTTKIDSSPGEGCRITVALNPFEQQLYDESSPADRPG